VTPTRSATTVEPKSLVALPGSRLATQATHVALIWLQADTWESYSTSAKVGLNTGCILIGITCILNHSE